MRSFAFRFTSPRNFILQFFRFSFFFFLFFNFVKANFELPMRPTTNNNVVKLSFTYKFNALKYSLTSSYGYAQTHCNISPANRRPTSLTSHEQEKKDRQIEPRLAYIQFYWRRDAKIEWSNSVGIGHSLSSCRHNIG